MSRSPTLVATLAMLAAVFLWSSATPGSKFVLDEIALAHFVVGRFALAAGALWLLVLITGVRAGLRSIGWRPLVMGVLEPGLVTLLVAFGLTMTSPVSGSVFWGLTPLIVPVLGRLVLREPIEPIVMVAAVVAVSGTMTLAWGQRHHGGGSLVGDLFVASGVLASAFNALLSRRNAQSGANALVTSSWQLTSACCVAAPLLLIMAPAKAAATDPSPLSVVVLLYLGLVVSAGVYILSNYAVRHLAVARMSLLGCLTAPLGAIMSALFLGTHISALDIGALCVVITAVALPALVKLRGKHGLDITPPTSGSTRPTG
jgi:drug/metabolite transporter (DMT)-like permease